MKYTREYLIDLLKNNTAKVTFVKVDGSTREMLCTLKEEIVIPYINKTENTRAPNTEVLRVWDMEKTEWRGFKIANITNVEVLV